MGDRPLRQYYGTRAPMTVSGGPDDVVVPWRRHRERFSAELAGLDESEWYVESRCDGWDMRQVVNHLSTADAFWMASLLGATTALLVYGLFEIGVLVQLYFNGAGDAYGGCARAPLQRADGRPVQPEAARADSCPSPGRARVVESGRAWRPVR